MGGGEEAWRVTQLATVGGGVGQGRGEGVQKVGV